MPTIVGVSAAARSLRDALPTAANSPDPLLIDGEPGSGRQLLAAAVHRLGPRAGRPFIAESLAALPESLQEPEIFGANGSPGLVTEADGGTLYLAGTERLGARGQELLSALLTREKGGPRIIASADADLDEAARRGRFRRDLAARLRARVIAVPPLRCAAGGHPATRRAFSNLETFLNSIPAYWKSYFDMWVRNVGDPRTEAGRALLRRGRRSIVPTQSVGHCSLGRAPTIRA